MLKVEIDRFEKSLQDKTREEIISITIDLFIQLGEKTALSKEEGRFDHEMFLDFVDMKTRLESAERENKVLKEQIEHLTGVRYKQDREMYGKSSEKASGLFNDSLCSECENPLSEDYDPAKGNIQDTSHRNIIGFPQRNKNNGSSSNTPKRKRKRDEWMSKLPQCKIYDCDINELNETYGEGMWIFSFWEAHDFIERQKASTYRKTVYTPVIRVIDQKKYIRLPFEQRIIDRSFVSASLLAEILNDFCSLSLPAYRMEHDADRFGFPLSRQTMINWIQYAGLTLLMPVTKYLTEMLKACTYQQCDETTYQVVSEKEHQTNYIWIHRTSECSEYKPIIIYCFEPSRSADHLFNFYGDRDTGLFLTCDAYGAYQSLELRFPNYVTVCGCMDHSRRKFVDAAFLLGCDIDDEKLKELPEVKVIELMGRLYAAEAKNKDMSPDERTDARQDDVRNIMETVVEYVESLDENDPLFSDTLKDAIKYFKNQKVRLCRFLENGNIPLSNIASEHMVKVIATHRKNSLFSYSIDGANALVSVISLIETAKANGALPYYYLKYLLERMPKSVIYGHEIDLDDMLPWSEKYRQYEQAQRMEIYMTGAPPGNEKPTTQPPKPSTEEVA